ncbi:MAG: succinate dehydrogenase [Gemmataceae bacterium]
MSQITYPARQEGFGATERTDAWWAGPLGTVLGLTAFLVYATLVLFWGALFGHPYFEIRQDRRQFSGPEVAPYLAPFHSPLLYDEHSAHAWIPRARPDWWPSWLHFSSAMLILIFPAGFRFTCYYYRKAYYRAFWADPPACVVAEPRKSYWGENHWPLLVQNIHRYFMYFAVLFLLLLWWDGLTAFWWPTDRSGTYLGGRRQFGIGVGTLVMVANVILLTGYTLGCHSLRHLVGGRLNCFACLHNGQYRVRPAYRLWWWSSRFNEHHMLWAWCSLISVGFTDLYIRLCAMGIWHDVRIL